MNFDPKKAVYSTFSVILWLQEGLECSRDDENVKQIWKIQKNLKLSKIILWNPQTRHKPLKIAIFEMFMNFDLQNKPF